MKYDSLQKTIEQIKKGSILLADTGTTMDEFKRLKFKKLPLSSSHDHMLDALRYSHMIIGVGERKSIFKSWRFWLFFTVAFIIGALLAIKIFN